MEQNETDRAKEETQVLIGSTEICYSFPLEMRLMQKITVRMPKAKTPREQFGDETRRTKGQDSKTDKTQHVHTHTRTIPISQRSIIERERETNTMNETDV